MTTAQVAVENGLVAADDAAAGALVAWLPGGVPFHEWQDEPMVRTYAAQRQEADGCMVFTHLQVDIAPLMVHLTEPLYEELACYLHLDSATSDCRRRSRRPSVPVASSSDTPPAPTSSRHASSACGPRTTTAQTEGRERPTRMKALFTSPFRWGGGGGGGLRSASRHALASELNLLPKPRHAPYEVV